MSINGFSQSLKHEWVNTFGGAGLEISYSLDVDSISNIYVTGSFDDIIDFDADTSAFNFTSNGLEDFFVLRADSSGNISWVHTFGGTGKDISQEISVSPSGEIYVIGSYENTVDFDPGPGIATNSSVGDYDLFIQKLDNNGNLLWVKSIGGISREIAFSMDFDTLGNIYVTGNFGETVDFDPGGSTQNATAIDFYDIFFLKLNSAGDFEWVKTIGGMSYHYSYGMVADNSGNLYITGFFNSTVDFDPGPSTYNLTSNGNSDIFVMKLDNNGDFAWANSMGGSQHDRGRSLTVDLLGNVIVTGEFSGNVDFDPGAGSHMLNYLSGSIFVQKLDNNGNLIWAGNEGGPGSNNSPSVKTDGLGNIYLTGNFSYNYDFDPGIDTFMVTEYGGQDVFIQKLDSAGGLIWVKTIGGSDNDLGRSIYYDSFGAIYLCGSFQDTVDFDPTANSEIRVSVNDYDIFLEKFRECQPSVSYDTISTCDSFTWIDGNEYVNSGDISYELVNSRGCDSIVMLNLTIHHSIEHVDSVNVCDSLTWIDGITYTSNNSSAQHVFSGVAANGCDSIWFLNLNINNSYATDIIASCGDYTWIDGVTYFSNNNSASFALTNHLGCDSLISLNLTINNVDTSISLNGTELSATNLASSYQWLDCDNNFAAIIDESDSSFSPIINGSYAVQIEQDGCVDTSSCYIVMGTEIVEPLKNKVVITPNPALAVISVETQSADPTLILYNQMGVELLVIRNGTSLSSIDISGLPSGVFIIRVFDDGIPVHTEKLIKK